MYRNRFNLADCRLLSEEVPHAHIPLRGGPFAQSWRPYMKSVFKKGYMYAVSCKPEALVYVAESKTLPGAEVRLHEGEASGRKLVVVFYRLDDRGLAHRVDAEDLDVKHVLLTLAELLQALEYALPVDPERTAATGELMLEAAYQVLEVTRFTCIVAPAVGPHVYELDDGVNAEEAYSQDLLPVDKKRTKMVLARFLERRGNLAADETLPVAWALDHAQLLARVAPLLPVLAAAVAGPPAGPGGGGLAAGPLAAPLAAAAGPLAGPLAAPGRRGRGKGKGKGKAGPPPPPAGPLRARGRGRGKGGRA